MFCPHCGAQNKDGALFCGSCGQSLPKKATASVTKAAAKPPRPHKPIISKDNAKTIVYYLLLATTYFITAFLMILLYSYQEGIGVYSLFEEGLHGYMSLADFCNLSINGNSAFNPTIVSTALALGSKIIIFAVAPLFAIAFITTIINGKRFFPLHILSVLFSFLASALTVAIVPVSLILVPELKYAAATQVNLLYSDVGAFSYTYLIVFAIVFLLLTVASTILTVIINKRRFQK